MPLAGSIVPLSLGLTEVLRVYRSIAAGVGAGVSAVGGSVVVSAGGLGVGSGSVC